MKPNKIYRWTIRVNLLPITAEIAYIENDEDSNTLSHPESDFDSQYVEFTNVKMSKEDLDKTLKDATTNSNYFSISFPLNYEVYTYMVPRECVTGVVICKMKSARRINTKIVAEANRIIANK